MDKANHVSLLSGWTSFQQNPTAAILLSAHPIGGVVEKIVEDSPQLPWINPNRVCCFQALTPLDASLLKLVPFCLNARIPRFCKRRSPFPSRKTAACKRPE